MLAASRSVRRYVPHPSVSFLLRRPPLILRATPVGHGARSAAFLAPQVGQELLLLSRIFSRFELFGRGALLAKVARVFRLSPLNRGTQLWSFPVRYKKIIRYTQMGDCSTVLF